MRPGNPQALEPPYDPARVEREWYRVWEEQGVFQPRGDGDPFVIAIPPPNVTGSLTMGHLLGESIRDLVIRWQRMEGRQVLYVPGMDHAGIATQNVVEKRLGEEGRSRMDLGREGFLREVWACRGHLSTKEQRRSERRVCRQEEDRVTVILGYGEQMRRQLLCRLQFRPL